MFNYDGAFFRTLYDLGIDLSNIDFSNMSDGEMFVLGISIMSCMFLLAYFIRGLFYCINSLNRSCFK